MARLAHVWALSGLLVGACILPRFEEDASLDDKLAAGGTDSGGSSAGERSYGGENNGGSDAGGVGGTAGTAGGGGDTAGTAGNTGGNSGQIIGAGGKAGGKGGQIGAAGGVVPAGGTTGGETAGGASGTGGASTGGVTPSGGTGGAAAGNGGQVSATGGGGEGGAGVGGQTADGGQQGGGTAEGGSQTGGAPAEGGTVSSCVGDVVPPADPTKTGPFQVAADKDVGPLAGVVPDPIYGDKQQRFNVYRPANLADSGYCHPILIWANGYTDNPEPNPPDCILDSDANKWCGRYLPLMEHLASQGFVVVASLSAATGSGDPLPTIVGLDWIIEQADDPSSPYYHHLDTANIGQLGHAFGGISTCMSASDPRYDALATICGTGALSGVHTPMLFYCGGKDTTAPCSDVKDVFLTVTDQPAFFIDEMNSDNGWWVYQGPGGVSLSMAAAWFRAHLMGDTESRKFFYGPDCTFCDDDRVQVERNSLMTQ